MGWGGWEWLPIMPLATQEEAPFYCALSLSLTSIQFTFARQFPLGAD